MINKQKPYVVVLGASIVDIFGFCTKKYMQCNSTPGCVKTSLGGVCRNIAENMARIGVKNKFISVLGDDNNGRELLRHSREVGYDMEDSLIVKGYSTPTYMAILDEQGEMVSAVVDMKSIDKLNKKFIDSKAHIIESAEYTFLDSDNPEILQYILEKFKGKTKFVLDPVSACKAKGVRHLVKYFHTIKPNRYEAEMLSGIKINNEEDLNKTVKYFHDLGVENVFISLDADGIFFSNGKEKGKFRANDVVVKNVTGAGDAFVAGIAYGYMNNLSIDDTVTYAITLASIAISHEDTIHPEVNHEFVMEYMNKLQWEKIKY